MTRLVKALIVFQFIFLGFESSAQGDPTNITVEDAYQICRIGGQDLSIKYTNESSNCLNNQMKLYYSFVPNQSVTIGSGTNYEISLSMITLVNSSPIIGSYELYGPFNENDNYSDLINLGLVNPISSDSPATGVHVVSGDVENAKIYIIVFTVQSCTGKMIISFPNDTGGLLYNCSDATIDCENCIPKFQPIEGKYVVSAWLKEENNPTATTYTNGILRATSGTNVYTLHGSGQIIDGWQRIEGEIITNSIGDLEIELLSTNGNVYFDDIRVFPVDGSIMTYVYDPVTMRLMAELDERNFAKIYEYDEEGKLIRVKKETEKGVMTIQENRENTHGN